MCLASTLLVPMLCGIVYVWTAQVDETADRAGEEPKASAAPGSCVHLCIFKRGGYAFSQYALLKSVQQDVLVVMQTYITFL